MQDKFICFSTVCGGGDWGGVGNDEGDIFLFLKQNFSHRGYIGGPDTSSIFPVDTWNKYDETLANLQRTNNTCEGWNSSWTKDVGPFPSLWTVLEELQNRDRLMTLKAQKDAAQVKYLIN